MKCAWLLLLVIPFAGFADDLVRTDARSVMYIYHSMERIVLPEGQYFSWKSNTLFDNHPDTVVTFVQIYRRPAAYWSTVRAAHFMDSMRVTRHVPSDSLYKWWHLRIGKKYNQSNPMIDIFEAGRPGEWWFSGPYEYNASSEGAFLVCPEWGVNAANLVPPLRNLGQSGDSAFS